MKQKIFALLCTLLLLTACSANKKGASSASNAQEALITEAQAQEAALKHAGFLSDEVTGLRVSYDIDDGRKEYDVEFFADDTEYDCTVDAVTGDIVSFDAEAVTKPTSTTTQTVTATLTEDDAEAIALAHAGVTADQAAGLRTKYEIDNNVPQYEVDFHVGATEYDYTIHGETGEILEFEIDD